MNDSIGLIFGIIQNSLNCLSYKHLFTFLKFPHRIAPLIIRNQRILLGSVIHWNRTSPISLTRNRSITQSVGYFSFSCTYFFQMLDNGFFCITRAQSIKLSGIYEYSRLCHTISSCMKTIPKYPMSRLSHYIT